MSGFQTGSFNTLPPVVKNLLIINILLFLATIGLQNSMDVDLNDMLGLHWVGAEKFKFYQVITYMFMHGSFNHILFNMFAVWMFGKSIESIWGSKRFLTYYLITGIGAAALHYGILYFETIQPFTVLIDAFLQNPNAETLGAFLNDYPVLTFGNSTDYTAEILNNATSGLQMEHTYEMISSFRVDYINQPTVIGASGSLFGILLAFGMMFPNAELYMMFIPIPIKAKYFVAGYGFFELYAGFSGSSDGIAHFAHLGGLITGFILIKIWQRFDPSFRLL